MLHQKIYELKISSFIFKPFKFKKMKKFVLVSLLSIISSILLMGYSLNQTKSLTKNTLLRKHVDVSITSTQGCTVHIVGEVDYSLIPPGINGFEGTVTISGGKGCPNGTLTFTFDERATNNQLSIHLDSNEIGKISSVNWIGINTDIISVLNDTNVNAELVELLNGL